MVQNGRADGISAGMQERLKRRSEHAGRTEFDDQHVHVKATKGLGLRAPEVKVPMMPPPLSAEDREENRSAGDLSDNSTQKSPANQSGNNRDSCGDQRGADIAPGVFPAKYPSQGSVT